MKQMIQTLQQQYETMNSFLKSYGVELKLDRIHLKSNVCDTCVEYVTVVRFYRREMYEAFVKSLTEKEKEECKKEECKNE